MIVRRAVNGEVGEARERIDQAIEALHTRRMHPDLMFSIIAVSVPNVLLPDIPRLARLVGQCLDGPSRPDCGYTYLSAE